MNLLREKLEIAEAIRPGIFETEEKKLNPYSIEFKLEGFRSFYGTGKTHLIQANLKNGKIILFISPRQTLSREVAKRLGIQNYQVLKDIGAYSNFTASMVTTIESLSEANLAAYANENTILIIDEAITVLNQIFAKINDDKRKKIFETLKYLAKRVGSVILLDANLRDIDFALFMNLLEDKMSEKFTFLKNSYYPEQKRKTDWYISKEAAIDIHLKNVRRGSREVVLCDTKAECDFLEKLHKNSGKKVINLNSETKHQYEDDFYRLNDLIEEKKPDVLLLSPTAFVGVSIEMKNYFDRIVAIFAGNTCDPYQLEQAIHRERNFNLDLGIWINPSFHENVLTEWHPVYKKNRERLKKLNHCSSIALNEQGFWDIKDEDEAWFIWNAQNQAEINRIKKHGVHVWLRERLENYCNIKVVKDISDTRKERLQNIAGGFKNKIKDKKKELLHNTELITEKSYKRIIEKEKVNLLSEKEYFEKNKFELATAFHLGSKDSVDSLYKLSMSQGKLLSIARRIKGISDPFEAFYEEKKSWSKAGFKDRFESYSLAGKVVKGIIFTLQDKPFCSSDLEKLFTLEKLENLSTITGKDYLQTLEQSVKSKALYKRIAKEKGEIFALDYIKEIQEGNLKTIQTFFPKCKERLEELEFQKAKKLFQLRAEQENSGNIQQRLNDLEQKYRQKQEKVLSYYQNQAKPNYVTVLSDFLTRYGIKLEFVTQNSSGIRFYKLDIEYVKSILPEEIVSLFKKYNGKDLSSSKEKAFTVVPNPNQERQEQILPFLE